MTFKDEPWRDREKSLGDLAEARFEATSAEPFVRSGLNRPPFELWKLPLCERYRPDYLTASGYVEVQGFGRKQVMALKQDKLAALKWWNDIFPVFLFVFDSLHARHTLATMEEVEGWCHDEQTDMGLFPEGKPYYAISSSLIFGNQP